MKTKKITKKIEKYKAKKSFEILINFEITV